MVNIHVRLGAEAALQHCSTGGAEGAQGVPRNAPRREVGAGGCEDGGLVGDGFWLGKRVALAGRYFVERFPQAT